MDVTDQSLVDIFTEIAKQGFGWALAAVLLIGCLIGWIVTNWYYKKVYCVRLQNKLAEEKAARAELEKACERYKRLCEEYTDLKEAMYAELSAEPDTPL